MTVQVRPPQLGGGSTTLTPGTSTSGPLARVLRHLPEYLLALLVAVVVKNSATSLDNQDTWFHLLLGERFLDGAPLGRPGPMGSAGTAPWVPTQWSTEMLAAAFERGFGLPGVAWLFGAFMVVLVLGVHALCRGAAGRLAAASTTALVVVAAAPALSARPQVVSLVLLTVTVGAWLRTAGDGRVRWWLVPLTWVWATAHGLWSAGVLVGVVACVGIALDRRFGARRTLLLLAVPLASVLAAALTPVGPRLLTSQLAVSARTPLIVEWGPTSFRTAPAFAAAVMVGVVVLLWARRGSVPWTPLLLLGLGAGWILLVSRMVAPGAVVVAPLLAGALTTARGARHVTRPGRRERLVLGGLAVAALSVLALVVPRTVTGPEGVPTGLGDRLAALPEGAPLLVEDGIGGWLEWQYPGAGPTIDGMLDAYPVTYIRAFMDMRTLEPGWQEFVRHSGARVGVLQARSPLTTALQDQLGWRVVDHDQEWVYVVAPSPR